MAARQQALAFFLYKGWTAPQSAGIVANLEAESGLRPDAVGDGGAAYGLPQWHQPRPRRGASIAGSTFEQQLQWVDDELHARDGATDESRAGSLLAQCTTAEQAAEVFCRHYERPADPDGDSRKRAALAAQIFAEYGGSSGEPAPQQQPEKPMGALALLQLFPMLSGLLPQIAPLLKPGSKAEALAPIAQIVIDTITKAANQPSLGGAVQAMQTDPAVKAAVQAAIVTQPQIIESLTIGEVGGGVVAARAADLASRAAPDGPFWKSSAVFYVSLLLVPMVLWYVGSSIAGGIDIPSDWPWYAQMPLKLLGKEWDDGARVGLANLVVGMVLGGICGVYFGVSVTQAKQTQQAADSKGNM